MAFVDDQVANDQDFMFWWRGRCSGCSGGRWRKEIRVRAVVYDCTPNVPLHSVLQNALHSRTDADYIARGTINVDRSPAPPANRRSVDETRIEDIQAVQGHHKWNTQMLRQQRCRMAAGQSRMRVDDVNGSLSVSPPHNLQGAQTNVEPPACARQAQISGNLRISHPMRCGRWARLPSTIVERRYRNDTARDSKLLQLPGCVRDETSAHFIASGREKWRQRQNVNCGLREPCCRRNIFLGVRQVWTQRSLPFDLGSIDPEKTDRTVSGPICSAHSWTTVIHFVSEKAILNP